MNLKRLAKQIIATATLFSMVAQPVSAAVLALATAPLYTGAAVPPLVMLDISKDQQLYKKAYNDFSDLDDDGVLETTYKHSVTYYGYFDSTKCYNYNTGTNQFEPFGTTTDKYCTGANASKWAGNFLNWTSMTRMDAVRKLLYGGLRSTDTATSTVLERAYLPTDAHSYTKYYAGTDTASLTPFTILTAAPTTTSATTVANGTGSKIWTLASTSNYRVGHQVSITSTAGAAGTMVGNITASAGSSITVTVDSSTTTVGNGTAWTVSNRTRIGLTICNATLGGTGAKGTGAIGSPQDKSQTNTNPPLMRVVQGDYALWASNERFQCYFQGETTSPNKSASLGGARSNGNRSGLSGLYSGAFEPDSATEGLGSVDYVVRVQACVTGLLGAEKCKEYATNNSFKPIGLLQVYGDPGLIHFGLMTGSYNKNISGGVLRKNTGTFTNEINADGVFLTPAGGSIVTTMNKLRIYGYNYGDGTYLGAGGDNCNFQLTNITEGRCRSWGNPMSEIYFETLRYFAGATAATAAFTTDDSPQIAGLVTATWPQTASTVLSSANYCAPLNALVFNASVSTNEDDGQMSSLAAINSASTVAALTNTVGANETGVNRVNASNQFFFGKNAGAASGSAGFELCTAKSATSGLGDVVGICPEGPTLGGTYFMAGLAHHAHINRIRTDITIPATDTKSLKVTTYGINLATNVPTLPIKASGDTNPRVILQPAYRLFNSAPQGGGALVDLKIVSQTVTATSSKGSIYLNWEDSEQGGDYDQDMWGTLSYCMQVGTDTTTCPENGGAANSISVTTRTIAESTGNPQGFGYIISGTIKDGPHFHSGIETFNFTDPANVSVIDVPSATNITGTGRINASGGCVGCQVTDAATRVVYTLGASGTATQLKDPLYYAAKYGGFKDTNANNLPDLVDEWDGLTTTGAAGYDGIPDNYFLVSNPLGLETALDKLFLTILASASSSSVATNSTSLNSGSRIYQAKFNTNDWSGQLIAFPISLSGAVGDTADWDGGQVSLSPATIVPNNRVIMTYVPTPAARRGIPFRWPANPASPTSNELTTTQSGYLNINPSTSTSDARGQERLDWMRGVATNEGTSVNDFRRRQTSKLGDIVNSNPNFQGPPSQGYASGSYATFANTYASRKPVIYVGSNDGMLHVFDAFSTGTKGTELMAYVPSKVMSKLNKLTNKAYTHQYLVDGSPAVTDASFIPGTATAPDSTSSWKTVLVGALGAGGQGIYALNVTDPTSWTESNAANTVLWEFTDADDADLGYVYGDIQIVQMANGKWAAVFSGGYNNIEPDNTVSATGNAHLFIVFLSGPTGAGGTWQSGTDYIKINTGVGSLATPNGLAAPAVFDKDLDGKVDYIFAGDLQGNLWKFDVSSTTPANWTNASNRRVLMIANDGSSTIGNLQPITSKAVVAKHITGTGYTVNFGTGKYLENTDTSGTFLTQSFYGIWDKNDGTGENPVSNQTVVSTAGTVGIRNQLMKQWVYQNATNGAGVVFRVNTNHQPNYTAANRTGDTIVEPDATSTVTTTPPQLGWYFDFPGTTPPTFTPITGERSVFTPLLISGKLIFTSLIPSTAACTGGGDSFFMVLNNQTGGRFNDSPFDVNGDGAFTSADKITIGGSTYAVSGAKSAIGITPTPTIIAGGSGSTGSGTIATGRGAVGGSIGGSATGGSSGAAVAVVSSSSGGTASVLLNLGKAFGRVSWRELLAD